MRSRCVRHRCLEKALQASRIFWSTHEGKGILEEIDKCVYGNNTSSRTLVSKAFRRAFYGPTALGEA
jgi:hypothetical protein